MKKSQPVIIAMSILAGLQFLFGGLSAVNLGDSGNTTLLAIGAVGTLAVAAAQTGIQFYVREQVVPINDVAAYKDKNGEVVTGPAAPPEGDPAAVVTSDDGTGL